MLLLVAGACSGSDASTNASSTATECEASAQQVVDRLDAFLEPFDALTPSEFLAAPELDGLDTFQNDVADLIVDVATNPNDDCTERDLEAEVDDALAIYASEGVLEAYLVGVVRQDLVAEARNVVVSPDDDLEQLLPLLGPGSSISFSEGSYDFDGSILVQNKLTMVGAGQGKTVINSTADTAAFAVLGRGELVMNDLTLRHVGELPASVIVVVDAPITLAGVEIVGGTVDSDGGGGSGLVLSGDRDTGAQATISSSRIADNDTAGIAVTEGFHVDVIDSQIEMNAQCGLCFFDTASGRVQRSSFTSNGVGVQASGSTAPEVSNNEFVDNAIAGVLVEDESSAVLVDNRLTSPEGIGIDIAGSSMPVVQRNELITHAIGISVRDQADAMVASNTVVGGDVGMFLDGAAAPTVESNDVAGTAVAGFLHTGMSAGVFRANMFRPETGAGVVVEGNASPEHQDATVEGGLVGFVFRQDATGRLDGATLSEQQVGFEVADAAAPMLENLKIVGAAEAGAILGGEGNPVVRSSTFVQPVEIGLQAGGTGSPTVEGNRFEGGDTAVLIIESTTATIERNVLADQQFGIGVSGEAEPTITENEIVNAVAASISFEGTTGGVVAQNTLIDAGVVGIRVGGESSPAIVDNTLFALAPAVNTAGAIG